MVVRDFIQTGKVDEKDFASKVREADAVVFQRPNSEKILNLMKALKQKGKKVIFENDDTYLLGKGIPLERLESDEQRELAKNLSFYTDACLRIADGVIASTEILGEEYRRINPNTVVLKNTIDPLDEFTCKPNETGKFRIGFIASVTTNDDYLHLKEQIRALDERGDITIVVLGLKHKDGSSISFMKPDVQFWSTLKNIEWHPYVHVTEYMHTLSKLALDLAVIPRKDSYFNRCKSSLKALEMSLLKIPVIAQSFGDGTGPYEGDLYPYLTLIEDNTQWYNSIVHIRDDYALYKKKAEQAHHFVLEHYSIKTYAQEWVRQIHNLCKSPQKS